MEITKDHLEEKLNLFNVQLKEAREQVSIWTIKADKLAGAVESIQLLLKELEEGTKAELNKK